MVESGKDDLKLRKKNPRKHGYNGNCACISDAPPTGTLPEINISHLKIGRTQKETKKYSNHPFSGASCLFQGG